MKAVLPRHPQAEQNQRASPRGKTPFDHRKKRGQGCQDHGRGGVYRKQRDNSQVFEQVEQPDASRQDIPALNIVRRGKPALEQPTQQQAEEECIHDGVKYVTRQLEIAIKDAVVCAVLPDDLEHLRGRCEEAQVERTD